MVFELRAPVRAARGCDEGSRSQARDGGPGASACRCTYGPSSDSDRTDHPTYRSAVTADTNDTGQAHRARSFAAGYAAHNPAGAAATATRNADPAADANTDPAASAHTTSATNAYTDSTAGADTPSAASVCATDDPIHTTPGHAASGRSGHAASDNTTDAATAACLAAGASDASASSAHDPGRASSRCSTDAGHVSDASYAIDRHDPATFGTDASYPGSGPSGTYRACGQTRWIPGCDYGRPPDHYDPFRADGVLPERGADQDVIDTTSGRGERRRRGRSDRRPLHGEPDHLQLPLDHPGSESVATGRFIRVSEAVPQRHERRRRDLPEADHRPAGVFDRRCEGLYASVLGRRHGNDPRLREPDGTVRKRPRRRFPLRHHRAHVDRHAAGLEGGQRSSAVLGR